MISLFKEGGRIVPGKSRALPVQNSDKMPQRVDVVVIGGGNIGCCTALELVERGLSVAICEKGVVAGESSGRSFGWIENQFLDPIKMDLMARSKILWEKMDARIDGDTGYRKDGMVSLLADDEAVTMAQGWLDGVQGQPGIDARIISGNELQSMIPNSTQTWKAGLYQPSDASAEPTMVAPAIAQAAMKRGAHILQGCTVRGLETSGGKVSAVITEKGKIECSIVVLAAGAWSPLFAGSLGIQLPQFQAHASMLRTKPFDGPEVSAWGNGYTWRKNIDTGYTLGAVNGATPITPSIIKNLFKLIPTMRAMWDQVDPVFSASTFFSQLATPSKWALDQISPFEKNRILAPEIRNRVLDEVKQNLNRDFPSFNVIEEAERWAGVMVTTLDNMPVISGADKIPGLYLGTGMYYGLAMAPAVGEALADLVTNRTPKFDLSPYRHSRFIDGSKLTFRD